MKKPRVHPTAFIAPNAVLVGDVTVEAEASVWFGCVLRAEEAPILVGPRTNVQDLTVIHTDPDQPCRLGAGVTVGHRAVIHGATVEDGALIGIGAIVLNGAVVGEEAIVGAGAVVTEGSVIPPRTLALGVPARVVRPLETADLERAREAAAWYVERARLYRAKNHGDTEDTERSLTLRNSVSSVSPWWNQIQGARMSEVAKLLRESEIFVGLPEEKILQILSIGEVRAFRAGETIIAEGEPSDELYVIQQGMVEVLVSSGTLADVPGPPEPTPVVQLGRGQVFGEMALVDRGNRSATVRCVEDGTVLFIIPREAFWQLCEADHHIGYVVMRNIARDLSFKLRHRNLPRVIAQR